MRVSFLSQSNYKDFERKFDMKRTIYNFIKQYCTYFNKKDSTKITIEQILCSKNNPNLAEIIKSLMNIQKEDSDVFENILAWDKDDILFDYLQILQRYIIRKEALKISIVELARESDVPVSTIKRIEGLHNIARFNTLCKILKTVGLKINVD